MQKLKYQMVSSGIMNKQINLRLTDKMLKAALKQADKQGFSSLQEFIKETLREKLFGPEFTKKELDLIKRLVEVTDRNQLWGTEEELFEKLK